MADSVMKITAIKLFEEYLLELRGALDQSYGMLRETTGLLELLVLPSPDPGVIQEAHDSIRRVSAFLPELDRVRLMKADETDVEEGKEDG